MQLLKAQDSIKVIRLDSANVPPIFFTWYADVIRCSKVTNVKPDDFYKIKWFVTPYWFIIDPNDSTNLAAYWSKRTNSIVLSLSATMDRKRISHEMLHSILNLPDSTQDVHPWLFFGELCKGFVTPH